MRWLSKPIIHLSILRRGSFACARRYLDQNVSISSRSDVHGNSHGRAIAGTTLLPDDPPGDISSPSGDEYDPHKNSAESEHDSEDDDEMMDVPSDEEIQAPAKKKNKAKSNKRSDVVAARMVPPVRKQAQSPSK